jgi:hypothetical protein
MIEMNAFDFLERGMRVDDRAKSSKFWVPVIFALTAFLERYRGFLHSLRSCRQGRKARG